MNVSIGMQSEEHIKDPNEGRLIESMGYRCLGFGRLWWRIREKLGLNMSLYGQFRSLLGLAISSLIIRQSHGKRSQSSY
jgi:hypothetical protein